MFGVLRVSAMSDPTTKPGQAEDELLVSCVEAPQGPVELEGRCWFSRACWWGWTRLDLAGTLQELPVGRRLPAGDVHQ